MEPVSETPTGPADYAAVSATYGTLLATLAWAALRRGEEAEQIVPAELAPLGLATFALTKTVVHEKAETWLRRPFVHEDREGRPPRGQGLRYAVGELLTCSRCMGTWSALGLVSLRLARPSAGRPVVTVLAAAAINDFLQMGFSFGRDRCNREGQEARIAERQARSGPRAA